MKAVERASALEKGATIFGYYTATPEIYGVVEFNQQGKAISLEEKPKQPKSNYAVTGLYFYDNKVIEYAKSIKPSHRGELEITDVNNCYLKDGTLRAEMMGRGVAWLDMGTHESLLQASDFISTIEQRQGLKIACLEEISLRNGWMTREGVAAEMTKMKNSSYGKYLKNLLDNPNL